MYGSLRDGVFGGTIEIPPVSYYIEPPQVVTGGNLTGRGGGGGGGPPPDAHSVIYSSRDVRLPPRGEEPAREWRDCVGEDGVNWPLFLENDISQN